MPEPTPWRYRDDAYYQKGAFEVEFLVTPLGEPDETAARRALQRLLLALRDETGLKISSFVDVWQDDEAAMPQDERDATVRYAVRYAADEPADEPADRDDEPADEPADQWSAELVIYNKLGVTSLAKLRRFMEQHLKSDVLPRIVLIDPKTEDRFHCTKFTIRYLFNEFTAHQPPNDWEHLRELLATEDRGYGELTAKSRQGNTTLLYRGHQYRELIRRDEVLTKRTGSWIAWTKEHNGKS